MVLAQTPAGGSAQAPPAQSSAEASRSLLDQAVKAESDMRLDVAADRLYQLLIEHPGTGDAVAARLRLARLLALAGKLPQALLECQLLRDGLTGDHPLRGEALDLGTVLARRLRARQSSGNAYFSTFEPVPARGVQALDEPRAIVFDGHRGFVLLDEGARRVYRVGADAATVVSSPQDPTAVTVLGGGSAVIAGKTGLATESPLRTTAMSGAWGGKSRQVKKVRSMAALSDGSVLAIDRDFDGVLRCQPAAGTCAPWGPPGKFRVVRTGPTDWVYLLDDKGQSVRVIDGAQRQITLLGPMLGGTKLEDIEDLTVDAAHGFYLLDSKLKRIHVIHMQTQPDGRIGPVLAASVILPQEGDRAVKSPAAIGASPDGAVVVAGKSPSRLMRFR